MAKIVQTESRAQVYLNALQRCSLSYAKIVQTESRAQVYLNALQRCSLSYSKIQIKSEKLTSFGGIFPIMEKFDRMLSHTIDSTLGLRSKVYGYQYSEIIRSLMCVYFCGGSCVEDVSSHLMKTLCLHPHLRTCSADTILRAIRELTTPNQSYRSDSGKSYDFNVASDLNNLLVNALLATGQLLPDNEYDFDFDHQFIETEKFDAKMTYKKFTGYSPLKADGSPRPR